MPKKLDPLSAVRRGEFKMPPFGRKADPASAVRPGEIRRPAKGDTASAKVGNYRAPVDTAGMDAEMKATMGIRRAKPGKKRK